MPTTISVGETVNFTAQFLEYDELTGQEEVIDPDTVEGIIYKLNTGTNQYAQFDTFTPTEPEEGLFSYDWLTTEIGNFRINFIGSFGSIDITNTRYIFVGPIGSTITLNSNQTYYFLTELEPMYLDPSFVLNYFPDGDLVEIGELIHWYSSELTSILNVNSISEITPLMQDFILASVLCDLSRIHTFNGGMNGFSSSESFTLGDLQVRNGINTGKSNGSLGRGSASSWCEVAALLRDQLSFSKAGGRTYVRGSAYNNPIPARHIKRGD